MTSRSRKVFVCSCEGTMPLDASALRKGCRGAEIETTDHLCRAEVERLYTRWQELESINK